MSQAKKRAAKRPERRTVHVVLSAPFEGWEATFLADFPLRVLADLEGNDVIGMGRGLDALVVEHNFPDAKDEVATSMLEVEPYDAVVAAVQQFTEELGKLPPR